MSTANLGRTRLDNVRALITTKWDRGYTQRVVESILSFYVDSSLDNDADSWELQIGDPYGNFVATLERNNEVRVELVSSSPGSAGHIFTGIADDVAYDQTGVLTISGRDYSSLALDSTCLPVAFKRVKAKYVVANQARKLGFTNISLAEIGQFKKTIKTDGSETYWEFWYRLYRNEKMWLWCGPNGALIGNRLNYQQDPSYYFGTPQNNDSAARKARYVPVEAVQIRKSTQARIGTAYVYWHNGKNHQVVKVPDPSLNPWLKKPNKIITDKVSHSLDKARGKGLDEIFEGNVGSLEIAITISQPGFIIKTNKMAMVRIPELGYSGEFFVVGWRMRADESGFVQEIRLREKNYALSRRVPHEPTITPPHTLPKTGLPGHLSPSQTDKAILAQMIPAENNHQAWADYFYKAAQRYASPWDADVFLAAIMSLSWTETNMRNIRESVGIHDNIEWFVYSDIKMQQVREASTWGLPDTKDKPVWGLPNADPVPNLKKDWEEIFANEIAQVTDIGKAHRELGVGPMQLTPRSLKIEADDFLVPAVDPAAGSVAYASMGPSIDTYLKSKGSPMAGHGATFVSAGIANDVDPRFMVAVAGAESTFGLHIATPYSAFNWLAGGPWTNWDDNIKDTTFHMNDYYITQNGWTTVAQIGAHWAPVGAANDPTGLNKNWPPNVSSFLNELGGNPQDVTLPADTKVAEAHKVGASHDQYSGGRWHPENNIYIGAKKFREVLDIINASPGDGKQIDWMVQAYAKYEGVSPEDPKTKRFRKALLVEPNFMGLTHETVPALRANSQLQVDKHTEGSTSQAVIPDGLPTDEQALAAFSGANTPDEGASADSSDPIKFLQAKYYKANGIKTVKFIVVHTTESGQIEGGAENNANWFATGIDRPGSAHYVVDNKVIIQCVKETDWAYGVIGTDSSNLVSLDAECIHIEHVGCSKYNSKIAGSPTDWTNEYSQDMMALAAKKAAKIARAYGIPTIHLTDFQMQNGYSGFVGHGDCTRVFPDPEADHTDPGPDWPWTAYMDMVRAS